VSFNSCAFSGHLGADVELRQTQTGTPVSNSRLAVTTGYGDKKATLWLTVTAFGKTAERMAEWLAKGSLVLVHGRLEEQVWQKTDGSEGRKLALIADSFENLTPRDKDAEPREEPIPPRRSRAPSPPPDADYGDVPF